MQSVEEIKNLKTSISDIADFDSYKDDELNTKIAPKTTEKKKRKTPKTSKISFAQILTIFQTQA